LDGVSSDLATTIARARLVGEAYVYASGDARVGWIGTVINALRAAQITLYVEPQLLRAVDYARQPPPLDQPNASRLNGLPRSRGDRGPNGDSYAVRNASTAGSIERTPSQNDLARVDLMRRAICRIHTREDGRFGDRKVFISAVWAQMIRLDIETGGGL